MKNEIKQLIGGLIDKTRAGKVNWRASDGSQFALDLNFATVTTDCYQDGINDDVYIFRLSNEQGMEIVNFVLSDSDDGFELVKQLQQTARSSYLKEDQVIQKIFESINSDSEIGKQLPF